MSNKSNLLLLLLFALTVCAVGWLGFQFASQQDQQIKISQINRSEQALLLMQNNISEYIKTHQNQLALLSNLDFAAIQDRLNADPLIHDILIFDHADGLVFPNQMTQEQQKNSYQWLDNIPHNEQGIGPNNLDSNWFIWYDQQKEKYIYWDISPTRKLFVELNNSMFMADFIYWLSQQPNIANQAYLIINDNQGRVFYQWGDDTIGHSDINIQKNLELPLAGWSMHYFSNLESLSAWSKRLFQIAVIGLLILVSIITYILFHIKRREQLEAQQRLSFINQVSHELKTPLTNIRLHGELLERTIEHKDEQGKSIQSITIIQQESERLTRLINNVLNFNSVNNNSLSLHYAPIDFNELLKQSIQSFKPSFEQLNISISLDNEIHSKVNVDKDVLIQTIGNLLSNIEKYAADSKQVTIKAKRHHKTILLTIQDQGQGINKKYREKIFDPFYRIKNDLTHATGSGLGLGLARELARLHGGDLVLLPVSFGTCFQLTIKENHA